MNDFTDKELAVEIELHQTRMSVFESQIRAARAESALAQVAGTETMQRLRALEQERDARAAAAVEKKIADAKPAAGAAE